MKIGMILRRVDLNDGVASHLDTLIAGLHKLGHEVFLFSGPVSYIEGWEHREESLLNHCAVWERGVFSSSRQYVTWLREAIRRHPVDILHVHGIKLVPATRFAVRWRLPVVATAHPSRTSTADPSPKRLRLMRAARVLLSPVLPNIAIAVSTEMADWFGRVMQMPPNRVRVICHGCDTGIFFPALPHERAEARTMLGLPSDACVCVMVGRFDAGKRHDTAVRALSRISAEGRKFALLIAGSGDAEKHIGELRRVADPESRVLIRCVTDVERIRPVYAASDLIIHPGEREAFALVVAEGMLCGLVPLRTPTGGAKDQITVGVTGFLFDIGDDVMLADRLRQLYDSPAERIAMAESARRHANHRFTAESMAINTFNVYRELTDTDSGERDERPEVVKRSTTPSHVLPESN